MGYITCMLQANISPAAAREVVTSAASTSTTAALVGALFDFTHAVRRGVADPSATMPILTRLVAAGPMRSCDLAQQLHLDQSTVSRHVAALSADGLVVRTPQEDDRRAHLVELTPAGADAARSLVSARVRQIEAVVASWPHDDIETFARLLDSFATGLTTHERTTA